MVSLLEIDCSVHAAAINRLKGDLAIKADQVLEIDCSIHDAALVRLKGDLAIKEDQGDLAIETSPTIQPEAVRKVLEDPELLSRILGFLNNGHAKDLVTSLQVSKPFFHGAATTLCRRIEVPLYEYSSTKDRDEYLTDWYCVSCHNEQPWPYRPPSGVTVHQSLHPGLSRAYLKQIEHTYRDRFPATATMKEMYKYVRVVTMEQHDSCDRLAESHPLPYLQTVIARGGHKQVCLPSVSQKGVICGFLPRHPFRLVLDYLCAGLICQQCTSPNLLSRYVETLVLRFQYESLHTRCSTQDLPQHFNPKRLVFLFKPESIRKEYGRSDADSDGCHMVAYGPGEGNDEFTNTFYRMAKMALAVGKDCRVYIVGADHAALHVRGLERYDSSLEGLRPLYPHSQRQRETIPLWRQIPLPKGARWVLDDEEPEICRWRSADGELHHMDEAMDLYDNYDSENYDSEDYESDDYDSDGYDSERVEKLKEAASGPLTPSQYVCYDQRGWLVSPSKPRRVAQEHVPWARALINKRVAVMETLVHRWIDHILDSRLPSTQSKKYQKTRDEIDQVRKIKHASIEFITTYQYHRLEGNDDEMDDPSKYL